MRKLFYYFFLLFLSSCGTVEDSEVLFLPQDRSIAEGLQRRSTVERQDIAGVSRLDVEGVRSTYYVIDRSRQIQERARRELSQIYLYDSEVSIRYDFAEGAYIHFIFEDSALSEIVFFTFTEWPAVQLATMMESLPNPNTGGAIGYLEYRFPPASCSRAIPHIDSMLAELRRSLDSLGNSPAASDELQEISVDGPYYIVTARLYPLLTATFGISANAGSLFESVQSTIREIRACAQALPPMPREYRF